ncbi:MAG: hypothetical protein NTV31_05205 [Bacteroidia bacterium]|nr:hypothetical protein [Bacteroidia bacterium]
MKRKTFFISVFTIIGLSVFILSGCWSDKKSVQINEVGSFTDTRDGKIYKTIKIGDQWIMAENLAYKPEQGNFWPYDNDSSNVNKYGYLYDWETSKKVAPEGWHLPTASDWKTLRKSLGGKRDVYKYLGGTMEKVYKQMLVGGCGFNALMAGIRTDDGRFMLLGKRTDFWSSTKSKPGQYFYTLDAKIDGKRRGFLDSKEGTAALSDQQDHVKWGKSVRLFKD